MIACDSTLDNLISQYRDINPNRPALLFNDMLVRGYRCTTLNSVRLELLDQLIFAKVNLGMLITLFDDFADNPKLRNANVLKALYQLPDDINIQNYNAREANTIQLAQKLSHTIFNFLQRHDSQQKYQQLFLFDLQQFYQCNRYCEIITDNPLLASQYEAQLLFPFNMGIVMAGMLDIAASSQVQPSELSQIRHCFHLGQRYGSLCNTLNTLDREVFESDLTNEALMIALKKQLIDKDMLASKAVDKINQRIKPVVTQLKLEQKDLLQRMLQYRSLKTFSTQQYVNGLVKLRQIHEQLRGKI